MMKENIQQKQLAWYGHAERIHRGDVEVDHKKRG